MNKELFELLNTTEVDNDKLIEILSASKRGDIDVDIISKVLLDLNDSGELLHPLAAWSVALTLLPGNSLGSLKIIEKHLDHLCFYEMSDHDREHHFEDTNKTVNYLVRSYAYQTPEELVLSVASDLAEKEITLQDNLDEEILTEIRKLTELIVGGGHYLHAHAPIDLNELVDNIESMVL